MTTEATPGALGSNDQLGLQPEAIGHLHSDGDFCLDRAVPQPVLWPVNLYTEDQLRAAVAAERERWQQIVKRVARDANRYGLEGVHCECEVSDSGALTSWKMHA